MLAQHSTHTLRKRVGVERKLKRRKFKTYSYFNILCLEKADKIVKTGTESSGIIEYI